MNSMMDLEKDWKTAWLKRSIERLEERFKRGETEVVLHIEEFQSLLTQLLAAHIHCDRLEEVLWSYAKYAFPVSQVFQVPPLSMFGGSITDVQGTAYGTWKSDGITVTEVPKANVITNPSPMDVHVYGKRRLWGSFGETAKPYRVCIRCGRSDEYLNHNKITTCP